MTGVRRAEADENPDDLIRPPGVYERYGAIVPVGMETWPETYGRVAEIEDTLKANDAVVATEAAARWNVEVGDALVIVGWRGETVEVEIGQIVDGAKLQNAEIVVWDRWAKTKGWVSPDRVVVWGERDLLEQTLATARMPIGVRPDARYSKVRVEASWLTPDPNTPMKIAELKALVGEYKYVQAGRAVMRIDKEWTDKLQNVTVAGITTRCAPGMQARLNAAFARMQQANLTSVLDLPRSKKYGGCFRGVEKPAEGYLRTSRPSVRAWGTSFELRLKLVGKGCDVVRAWRAAGWAWVGTGPRSLVFQYTGRSSTGFFSPKCR
jgi:hypothetical protein